MLCLTLRFDGCLRGRGGGAAAVLYDQDDRVVWQGTRYLEKPATSAHAEYEGLILGLRWARRLQASEISAEGDCRLVVQQMNGEASARKLSRLHTAAAALCMVPLTVTHIPREDNAHADRLSRAAVDAQQQCHAAAVLGSARSGRREDAVRLLCAATQRGVPRRAGLYDELLGLCEASADWTAVLAVFRLAQEEGACSDVALEAALRAHEASGLLRGPEPASVRRTLAARARRPSPASVAPRPRTSRPGEEGLVLPWRTSFEAAAGGAVALRGHAPERTAALLALAAQLASADGFGLGADGAASSPAAA